MKKTTILALLLAAVMLFGACGTLTEIDKIDTEAAKAIALKALSLTGEEVSYAEAVLKERDGRKYYDVKITVDGIEYMFAVDATCLFAEVMEKAATLLSGMNITLLYEGPTTPVCLLADGERIERAVYNLISNAVKFSPGGSTIQATLKRKKDLLFFTLTDPGERIAQEAQANVFNRFMRQPGLGDSRFGLGLGLNIVHNTATAHGGTVLLENPPTGGLRITVTLKIRQSTSTVVRSPYRLDYAGGHDHGLVELSDVLPASAYEKEF